MRKIILALLVSYSGLWGVFSQELTLFGDQVSLGTLLVFLAVLSFSLYVLFGKS